jgi:hypothetical protein
MTHPSTISADWEASQALCLSVRPDRKELKNGYAIECVA